MFKNIFLFMLMLCQLSFSYKILVVFPFPRKSHQILGEAYVRHLIAAGHEVTYVTTSLLNKFDPNLRQIDIHTIGKHLPEQDITIKNHKKFNNTTRQLYGIHAVMAKLSKAAVLHENIQKLIQDSKETFDAVIVEYMFNELFSGLSSVFNCPLIWSSSMEINNIFRLLIDDPDNPAYTYTLFTNYDPPFTFWDRIFNLYQLVLNKYYKWLLYDEENEIFIKSFGEAVAKRGRTLPPYNIVRYNASLMLGNTNTAVGQAMHLPQSYKHIGGYHLKDEMEPLPDDLKTIMDNAKNGVIYFSLGSIIHSKDLPDDMKVEIIEVFRHINQTVVWKFEEDSISNIPDNVIIVNWAPQQSILAHPNCVLFITHGGLLSLIEAIHVGVPVIGIPIFADQFLNVNRVVAKGYGKKVEFEPEMAANLKLAIKDIIENSSYYHKAKEYSTIFHHRLVTPGKELVHWVEHVIQTRGALHLRSPSLNVPFYQTLYLDLALVVFILICIIIKICKYIYICAKFVTFKIKSD